MSHKLQWNWEAVSPQQSTERGLGVGAGLKAEKTPELAWVEEDRSCALGWSQGRNCLGWDRIDHHYLPQHSLVITSLGNGLLNSYGDSLS